MASLSLTVVPEDSDNYVNQAWGLKEKIRRQQDILKQEEEFFLEAFTDVRVYCLLDERDELRGFAAVRDNGYILFLAVDPSLQGEGHGRELIKLVANDYPVVTCHVRTTNETAVGFYQRLGFHIARQNRNYYADGGNAHYLTLDRESFLEVVDMDELIDEA